LCFCLLYKNIGAFSLKWHFFYVLFDNQKNIFLQYNICILTRIHNDHMYLKEWIEYHRILGIDQFYIADDCTNNDGGETDKILSEYDQRGIVTYSPRQEFNDCSNHSPNEHALFNFLFETANGNC
jgi:Glycosyltransferase family 92